MYLVEKYKCKIGSKIISELNEYDEAELKKYLFNTLNQLYAIEDEDEINYNNEDSEESDLSNDSDKENKEQIELESPDII